jgi:putative IMPACT (imprinted ancient) family translation regulator
MRIIKEKNLEIITQKMERDCKIEIATRKSNTNEIDSIFKNIFEVRVEIKE